MEGRLRVNRLHVERRDGRVKVEVQLTHDSQALEGRGEAAESTEGSLQAAATATVEALNQMLPAPTLHFDEALVQTIAQREAVIVQLRLRSQEVEERLVGSALIDRMPEEAAVRAVLNAAERKTTSLKA